MATFFKFEQLGESFVTDTRHLFAEKCSILIRKAEELPNFRRITMV
jgi:hypothetical protein